MKAQRIILLSATVIGMATAAMAQLKVNPQLGAVFTDLSNDPSGVTTKAAVGFQVGSDLRLGDRLYFQPGAFFGRSATVVKLNAADTSAIEDNLIRTTAKLKALVGYNIIHGEQFKLRVNAGPTYEALLSVDSKNDKIAFNKDDYNGGSFNMDAGLGLDLSILTLEGDVSYGLSNAYKNQGKLLGDAKYFTYYLTLGLVFGGGK
ncbi:MAG: outer membrane beta-barrel protein [Flavobacteriales bacterium]|nr:outer membrane beta-barrel protein [Flavobacteriales bacterium]